MPSDPIASMVLQFLDANVDSIQQLEILRALGEDRGRQWTARELADASQTDLSAIANQLTQLETRGLVKTELTGNEMVCRYAPRTPEIASLLEQLLQAYVAHPVSLIKRVYDRKRQLSAFSESFRLRKES
jgi:DNA-binding MarR family transcriptional regulator